MVTAAADVTDVFVVGGGPAGLGAALAARARGLSVMLADSAHPPIDKACGEGLMPAGVTALGRLGVPIGQLRTCAFDGIRFIEDEIVAEARFPGARGLGIRRTDLHRALAQAAAERGVITRWGSRVEAIDDGGVRVDGKKIACRWIIGADGHNSQVREWIGIRTPARARRRAGLRQHFRVRPWSDLVEVYWHPLGQAYVTPVGSEEVCVAVTGARRTVRISDLAQVFPALAKRLEGASAASAVRGGISTSVRLRSVTKGRVALIGDASGSADSITGDGVSIALRQSFALADAIAQDDPRHYQRAHAKILLMPLIMGRLLVLVGEHRRLRARVLAALASRPRIFARLLAVHAGAASPAEIGLDTIAALGWRILAARAPVRRAS
jgi:flavin-dependent dehydrogenase